MGEVDGRRWRVGKLCSRSRPQILCKKGRYMRTFGYRSELNQSPSTASFGCLYPYMLRAVLCPDICRVCACFHTGLAVTCLQVEVVSGFIKVSPTHEQKSRGHDEPVPWADRDDPSIALLDLRVRHVRSHVRTVGFHNVDLVVQALG